MSLLHLSAHLRAAANRRFAWETVVGILLLVDSFPANAQPIPSVATASRVAASSVPRAAPLGDSLVAPRLLAAAQRIARTTSPSLVAARAEQAAAIARAAASGFAAPVTLSAGVSEAPNGDPSQGNLRLELGRELFTARRRRAEREIAEAAVLRAKAELQLAERDVDAAVLRRVITASGWSSIAARLSAEDVLLSGADESVRSRFAVGAARYVDVLRLRTERLRVQTERADAFAQLRASREALAGLLGERAPEASALIDSLVQLRAPDAEGGAIATWRSVLAPLPSLDSLVELASDVRLADVVTRQARAELALGVAQRRSQLSGYAGVQRIGQANNGPAFGPSVGVTLSLPFTAARASTLAAQADQSGVDAADVNKRARKAGTRTRVEIAMARFDAARERLTVFDAALLQGAREERESALAAYRTGGLSLLEFLDFERALARAEIDRVRALIDAADAYADGLTGGGDESVSVPLTFSAPDRR